MAETNERIHIDDKTGRRLAHPDDATTGGSYVLKGKEMRDWLAAHPDQREVEQPEAESESKSASKSANKAKEPGENK